MGLWESNESGCWTACGFKGGKCDHCGENGYCCTLGKNKEKENGNCPAGALDTLVHLSSAGHRCVQFLQGNNSPRPHNL